MPLFKDTTPEEIRDFLASREFENDIEYMKSMDIAWHNVMNHPQALRWLENERTRETSDRDKRSGTVR